MAEGDVKELPLIVKADVQGSIEVLVKALQKLSDDKSRSRSSTPASAPSPSATSLLAIGRQRDRHRLQRSAGRQGGRRGQVRERRYPPPPVIYNVTDEVKKAMTGMLEPTLKETRLGSAAVRELFKVPKIGTIAGCMVTDGRITRSGDAQARLLRDNVVILEGKISSLRRFKDDVSRGQGRLRVRHRVRPLQRPQGRRRH